MYWSWNKDTNGNYIFTDVTKLYTEVSALTNRTNDLSITPLAGVEKFTKEKTFAKGMPLTNLKLTASLNPENLRSQPENITAFSEIRENRKPLDLMINKNNDCSLFFEFNPFTSSSILRAYNLVENDNIPTLQNVTAVANQLFDSATSYDSTNTSTIEPILLFGFKYRFNQYVSGMDKVPKFEILSGNSSLLISYFVLDEQEGPTQVLSSDGTTTSGTSSSATQYQKLLPSEAYIIVEPRAANSSPSLSFKITYDETDIQTFTFHT